MATRCMAMWGGGGEWEAARRQGTQLFAEQRPPAAAAMPDYELRKALNFEVYPTRGVMMRDNGRCSVSVCTFGVF